MATPEAQISSTVEQDGPEQVNYDSTDKAIKPAPSCWEGTWEPCNDFQCGARNASFPVFVKTVLTREYVEAFDAAAKKNDLRYRFIVDVDPSVIVRQIHEVEDDAEVDVSKPSEWIGFGDACYEHHIFVENLRRDGHDAWSDHFVHFSYLIVDDACMAAGLDETAEEHRANPAPIEGYVAKERVRVRLDACSRPRKPDETGFQIIVVTNAPDSSDDLELGPWKSTTKVFRAPLHQIATLGLVERVTQTPTMWYDDVDYAFSICPPLELSAPRPGEMRLFMWQQLKDMAGAKMARAEKAGTDEKQGDKAEADISTVKD